jgi:Pectate lyase superfamily protein
LLKWKNAKHNLRRTIFICVSLLPLLALLSWLQNGYMRSVKTFGAIGDGIADDRVAIQATIDDVAAHRGGVVYFPAGIYKITIYTPPDGQFPWPRALTIRPNIRLQGVNSTSSVIKLANAQAPYGALLAPEPLDADVSGFKMCDLGVDVNGLNNPLPTAAEINEPVWNKRLARNTVFIHRGTGLRFERCRFSNFIGVWCLMLYSYEVSDVSISQNIFDKVGGGGLDFDSSTVDTAGHNCRITDNRFYSRNHNASSGPLTYGLRTAIEVHNVNALVANNQIYGFPIGINLGGNSQHGNQFHTAFRNFIKDAYNGIVIWSDKPDDGSSVGMQNCSIRDNTIRLNVDGWQAYRGKGGHSNGILIAQEGNSDAEVWNLEVANNRISYTNYNGIRDALIDAYSAGIYYDRWNWQSNNVGSSSGSMRFLNNTIDHPLGNGLYFRAAMKGVEISNNIVIDPAAGKASFWDGWKAGLFLIGPQSDLNVSNNRFVDDRVSRKMPYGIYAANDIYGSCIDRGNTLVDASGGNLAIPLLQRDSGVGSWDQNPSK